MSSRVMFCNATLVVPSLTATMQPESVTALDISPYNTFTLRCFADVPSNVLLLKSFEWRNGSTTISDNGNTILISDRNTNKAQSTSELTVDNPSAGSYTYVCSVTISIPGGADLVAQASSSVTVKGMVSMQGRYFCRSRHLWLCMLFRVFVI